MHNWQQKFPADRTDGCADFADIIIDCVYLQANRRNQRETIRPANKKRGQGLG
jgi:hypothetical protein